MVGKYLYSVQLSSVMNNSLSYITRSSLCNVFVRLLFDAGYLTEIIILWPVSVRAFVSLGTISATDRLFVCLYICVCVCVCVCV